MKAIFGHDGYSVFGDSGIQDGINSMATAIIILAERLKALEDERNKN